MAVRATARTVLAICSIAAALLTFSTGSPAVQAKPAFDRLSILVPAERGGGLDLTAKAIAEALQATGAVALVDIDYSPGAGGLIGLAQFLSSKKGDGTALMVGSMFTVGAVVPNRSAVSLLDTTPIARLTWDDAVVAVPADSRINTASDLVEALVSVPDSVSWVGGSKGGVDEMLLLQIARALGVPASHLHYTPLPGGGEVGAALTSGEYTAGISGYSEFEGLVNAGKLRLILVTAKDAANVVGAQTFRDLGIAVDRMNWRGAFAPPEIDSAQRALLVDAIGQMVQSPEWQRLLRRYHWQDGFLEGDAFTQFVRDEQERSSLDFAELRRGDDSDLKTVGRVLGRRYVWTIALAVLSLMLLGLMYTLQSRARHREEGLQHAFEQATGMANLRAEELERALAGIHAQIDEEFSNWHLSAAEREIALLMLKGLRLKEIADARGTSERTVRQQAQMVYRKAGLKGRSDLAAYFIEDFMQSVEFDKATAADQAKESQ